MLEVLNLRKSFKNIAAVQGVSFKAPDAQITGLLGPNGAGKTTTLRILYTVLKPDSGTARVDGFDSVTATQEVQQRIGVLPDSRGLYPRFTARENVRYYGRLHGLRGAVLEQQIQDLVKLLDMQEFADRRTEGFSQGQRLKVAIARALVHQPQNILLDEPTNGLDVMSTRALRTVIRRFRDEGKCVLFSSHVMQEVAALCDTVIVITRGQVVAEGTPEQLRRTTGQENLEDAFVAAIGSGEGLML
ncbi:ABC transporter ATP-binding protein [Anthocerotibacter panamensis]|uniref:ABC transporter ATP-binding protein n=1 Tax=Anthocerotibacter panamensis TaxID=2857077 RepID=UPI001C407FF0|nr:ATP-binding cassette domain-containing protein [Anthocerotibacter panamensis]